MGYLNKETVTVDAILTKKGRELLSQGGTAFNITKFAVSDDEIDYGLYNTAHPLGSEYYGSSIENMPVIEASPDETQNLRYKLVTLIGDATGRVDQIPVVRFDGQNNVSSLNLIESDTNGTTFQPTTTPGNYDGAGAGYTVVIYDADAVLLQSVTPIAGQTAAQASRTTNTLSGTARIVVGTSFTIRAGDVDSETTTQISVTGNESGATITIPVTVTPEAT